VIALRGAALNLESPNSCNLLALSLPTTDACQAITSVSVEVMARYTP
jgi:hypothetical protein